MRKNLIPLLAIALVIAGLCTVIFYGLVADRFAGPAPKAAEAALTPILVAAKTLDRGRVLESADLKTVEAACPGKCFPHASHLLGRPLVEGVVEGQPFTEDVVASRSAGSSPSAAVPVGWRAVTLHAADSSGVVKMVRSGDRVDLQVIGNPDPQSPYLSVQRVWKNVEVLNTGPADPGSTHAGRPVMTVLMAPADAEQLSLADTMARIRVVLRNRQEQNDAAMVKGAAMPSKTVVNAAPAVSMPKATATPPPATPGGAAAGAGFLVRLVSVNPADLALFGANAAEVQPQVRTLARGGIEQTLARLEEDKSARVLGQRKLALSSQRDATFTLGADGERLEQVGPGAAGVKLKIRGVDAQRWRLEPEAYTGDPGVLSGRRAEAEAALTDGQAWLVSGLLEHKEGRPVLPGAGNATEPRLILLVTPVRP